MSTTGRRGRPGGNPEFGTKYKFDYGRDKPLDARVQVAMYQNVKDKLQDIAKQNCCSIPDVVRTAIDEYLKKFEEKNTP